MSYNSDEKQRSKDPASPLTNGIVNHWPLGEACKQSKIAHNNNDPSITPNQAASKLALKKTPTVDNCQVIQSNKVSLPLTKDHRTSNSDDSSVCHSSLSGDCSEDFGVPAGESTRIHSRDSVSRILSAADLSNVSLGGFDDSENDSYKMLNIERVKPGISYKNVDEEMKCRLVENNLLMENDSDNDNLFVTCLSSQSSNSSLCSHTGLMNDPTQDYLDTSSNSLSSYEVVDVATQMPSVSDGSPFTDKGRKKEDSIVFVPDESSDGVSQMLASIGIPMDGGKTIPDSDMADGEVVEVLNNSLSDLSDVLSNKNSGHVQACNSVTISQSQQEMDGNARKDACVMPQKWR